jgi:hypothetical protein
MAVDEGNRLHLQCNTVARNPRSVAPGFSASVGEFLFVKDADWNVENKKNELNVAINKQVGCQTYSSDPNKPMVFAIMSKDVTYQGFWFLSLEVALQMNFVRPWWLMMKFIPFIFPPSISRKTLTEIALTEEITWYTPTLAVCSLDNKRRLQNSSFERCWCGRRRQQHKLVINQTPIVTKVGMVMMTIRRRTMEILRMSQEERLNT